MKVLIIAHHREKSGWGRACRDLIKCVSQQIDTVVRPIILGDNVVDTEIEKLENKNLLDVTHCIQYTLPHYFSKCGVLDKNIGISNIETKNHKFNNVEKYISLVDNFWNPGIKQGFLNEKCLYQPFEYSNTNHRIDIPEISGTYKFYIVGEFIERKNYENIIKSYFMSFNNEPVSLVIKSSVPGQTKEQSYKTISSFIENIKIGCKKKNYPKIHLIVDYLSDEDIKGLHKLCDCYIDFSYGEAINYGLLESAYFGNDIISTENNKYGRLISNKICEVTNEPCYGQIYTFPWYNNTYEEWGRPSISNLIHYMKTSYEKRERFEYKQLDSLNFKNSGPKILEMLL